MSYLLYKQNILNSTSNIKTDVSSQTVSSSSDIYIAGSDVTHVPNESAQQVIYEFYFQYSHTPDTNNQFSAELYEDSGSGFNAMGINYRCNEVTYGTKFENFVCFKFILPAYTGSRSYKLLASGRSTGDELALHADFDSNICYPIVLMYDIL